MQIWLAELGDNIWRSICLHFGINLYPIKHIYQYMLLIAIHFHCLWVRHGGLGYKQVFDNVVCRWLCFIRYIVRALSDTLNWVIHFMVQFHVCCIYYTHTISFPKVIDIIVTAIDQITKPLEIIKVQKAANTFHVQPFKTSRSHGQLYIHIGI